MKVKDLHRGMFLKPKHFYRWTLAYNPTTLSVFRGTLDIDLNCTDDYAIYLGTRSDLDIPYHDRCDWSNRYCLYQGGILPVDKSDWPYIEPVIF